MNIHIIDSGMKVDFDDQYYGRKSFMILPTATSVAVGDLLAIREPAEADPRPTGRSCVIAAVTHLEPLPPDRQIVSFKVFGRADERGNETVFRPPA
jgi:hypothetical protein